jgi:hypothetical protein
MRRLVLALVATAALAAASSALAGGVSGPAIWANGTLYRTVGTPTDFTKTGAPLSSFQVLYAVPGQAAVTTAGPGDPGFRGGRWRKYAVTYNTDRATTIAAYGTGGASAADLDSAAEVEAALNDPGPAGITLGPLVAMFECPVIALPNGGR